MNPPLDIEPEITIYAIANSLAETCHVSRVQFSVNGKSDVMFRDAMSLDRLYEEKYQADPGGIKFMKKRPLCLACIGLMILIFLMKLAGVSLWGETCRQVGNPFRCADG